ncbi:MAG: hypothetical protein A3F78_09070 [Burkholderiales bacterium RIFCSPLOWO2_12_FULL_61_40]|nr:MAG: hypothetical protein A3F78_09070 [Burkholderiales bacterium RIFCSPLOWO2_12_FULL_61_40]
MDIQDFGRIDGLINHAGTNADALLAKYGIRVATPEEIAHSALFILENDYFTGRVLEVDGGLRL